MPHHINLLDPPKEAEEQQEAWCKYFSRLMHSPLSWLFLSHDQAKTLKTQNSLGVVVENHQGQQENELRSDTHG